jgi:4-amino-4-deoxy-L-arabinose transferase-like glycosyltransferase
MNERLAAVADAAPVPALAPRRPGMNAPTALRAGILGRPLAIACLAWITLTAVALATRPLLPIDETRYLSVAWEMHLSGDWLVPRLGGQPYSHKGPLLFWLINALWRVTGPAELPARLIAPLFGLICLPLTAWLARLLWPERPHVASWAPLVLVGGAFWSVFASLTYVDPLLCATVLMGACGLAAAAAGRALGWVLLAPAVALGVLVKGPLVLVHLAPLAVFAPWWAPLQRRRALGWWARCIAAMALGVAVALAWVLPAARAGGPEYAHEILLGQYADRVLSSFAHAKPLWWYLPLLPLLLLPWTLWPPLWRAVVSGQVRAPLVEPGTRACLAWIAAALIELSLISGKLPHYLLPLLPAFALLIARLMPLCRPRGRGDAAPLGTLQILAGAAGLALPIVRTARMPDWVGDIQPFGATLIIAAGALLLARPWSRPRAAATVTALAMLLALVGAHLAAQPALRAGYDVAPMAAQVARLQERGMRVWFVGLYHGEYGWLGRLREPLPRVEDGDLRRWLAGHRSDAFVAIYRADGDVPGDADFSQPYRSRKRIGLWRADRAWDALCAHPPLEFGPGFTFARNAFAASDDE